MSLGADVTGRQAADPIASESLADLIANASIDIAPRERGSVAQVAQALPVNTCVYVAAPALRPLSESLEAMSAVRRAGLDPVPHIAARRFASRAELTDFVATAVGAHGVHRVMLISGDESAAKGPYADSLQVLEDEVLARAGIREIGVAGYPEGHDHISSDALQAAFTRKLALASAQGLGVYVVTQFSFAPTRIVAFCADLSRRAPQVPVYVGMAGPTDPLALMRYAQICGVSASLRAMRSIGLSMIGLAMHTDPQEQLHALVHGRADNIVGIHLYSLGDALRTAQWLGERLRPA